MMRVKSLHIIMHFSKYKYTDSPVDFKNSPDIAQSVIENVMWSIDVLDMYINDVGNISLS